MLPNRTRPIRRQGTASSSQQSSGDTNGYTNGHTNGHANGYTNGQTNGAPGGSPPGGSSNNGPPGDPFPDAAFEDVSAFVVPGSFNDPNNSPSVTIRFDPDSNGDQRPDRTLSGNSARNAQIAVSRAWADDLPLTVTFWGRNLALVSYRRT